MAEAWKWQLRDRLGQWMNMNSEVRWLSRGQMEQGHVVGSPKEGVATIRGVDGKNVNVLTSRLTAITLPAGDTPPKGRPTLPQIPKDFSSLSNKQVTDLYWAARDHPDVPLRKWARVAWEVQKRKIQLDPHTPTLLPAGMFGAGPPAPTRAAMTRMMQIRIIEREQGLRTP